MVIEKSLAFRFWPFIVQNALKPEETPSGNMDLNGTPAWAWKSKKKLQKTVLLIFASR